MRKSMKSIFAVLFVLSSLILLSTVTAQAADDPYWPQSMYDHIEDTIMDNVPKVLDAGGQYSFKTVDGTFTYSVLLTDFDPHTSTEDVFSARPAVSETEPAIGSILTRREVEDWTWAFRAALQDVADHGGGTVVVPAGTYITGAIRYRGDNTRIHLENGAEIQFIRNLQYGTNVRNNPTTELPPVTPKAGEWDDWYPQEKTRYECRDIYGFSPLIYAYGLKNIALTGAGNGGPNAITGDGRLPTDAADIDGNDHPDGYIQVTDGSPLSIINGMADSRHMRSSGFTATLPVYDVDNATVLVPAGTTGTFNLDPSTGKPVAAGTSGSLSYSNWITSLMNAWEPIEARKIPDLVPLDAAFLTDAQKVVRNFRRVNQYRPTFIEPHECQNILISDFYLSNSPFWELHPTYSQNIRVSGLHINSHGGNNDGCDPDSSQYVLIEDCIFNTGDDCIAIKCGRDNDAYQPWNMPSTHMIIRNNLMKDGHGGMVAGSEMGGGVEWIFSHNNKYDSPNLFFGLRIKTNSSRGGYIRHIYMKDTEVKALMAAFATVNFYYDNDSDTRVPTASDIYISNCYSPAGGFTTFPKLGLIMAKQYGNSPISGIHFKNCTFEGFYQSPNNPDNPNRPVTNLMCIAPGGIEYNNVRINGELYQPPQQSSSINTLIFTKSDDSSVVRTITKPEDLEALINESRAAGAAGMNWDISIVAQVEGYDYKGTHYGITDTIANSTYTGPLGGASSRSTPTLEEKHNGGILYTNSDGQSPFIRNEDREYPYYRTNGIPAYEAFVRVNLRVSVPSTTRFVNDWGIDVETFDVGPNYVIDLRTPGRVDSLGDDLYAIKLRENVNMGNMNEIRTGVALLNKVEVVLRNALFTDDQDFVFYSALPMITETRIEVGEALFVMSFDRPMNPNYLSTLEALELKLSADGSAVSIGDIGVWSFDGMSVSFEIHDDIDPAKYYTVDAFDRTSQVLSYRGNVPVAVVSSARDITSISLPSNAAVSGTRITATAASSSSSRTISVSVSAGASWALFSDADCTAEIADKVMTLPLDVNTAYIKVTAADGMTKTYTITITKEATGGGIATSTTPKGTTVTQKTNADGTIQLEVLVDGKPITKPLDKPVLVTVPLGSMGKNSVACIVGADGTETPIIFSKTAGGNMELLLSSSEKIVIREIKSGFTDLTGHWSLNEALFVFGRKLFLGTSETEFSPEATVTLATLPQVLYRIAGEPKLGANDTYPGIEAGMWYSDAMNWFGGKIMGAALAEDITKRSPDDVVSTEILMTMLYGYAVKSGLVAADAKFTVPAGKYGDNKVSDFATDAMAWAVSTGLLVGNENGIVVPGATVTRAVLVTIVARFVSQQVVK